jgi:hypothetical protein
MPPHEAAALLQQLQHHCAIPKFVDLQRRPFLNPGERISNIRKCQGRQSLAGCLELSHLRCFPLTPLRIMETGRQFKATTARRPHCRSSMLGKSLEQPGPLQHLRGLFEKIHRCLKGKRLTLGACLTLPSYEAKEGQADARPQATKNRRRIRWNTVRIFRGREQRRCLAIIRRSRTVNVGQAPRITEL